MDDGRVVGMSQAAVEMTSTTTPSSQVNGSAAMTEIRPSLKADGLQLSSNGGTSCADDTGAEPTTLAVDKVSKRVVFSYGAPGFATTSLSFLISVYANDFYVAVGASLSFLSFFTALARSFDVITDPVMGWFSDNFKHPMGRRRPFILLGAPFYGLLFFLLFSPTLLMNRHSPKAFNDFPIVNPTNVTNLEAQWQVTRHGAAQHVVDSEGCGADAGSSGIAYWFGTFYTVFYLFDTLSNVPYESLGPELSDSYDERSRIFFIAKVFNFLGMMFAAGAPATGQAFYRNRHKSMESLPCDYFYNPYADGATSRHRHGSWHPYQLVYEDAFSGVHRLAEYCNNGKGDFCFVMRLHSPDGKTHDYFFEQDPVTIANTCGGYWCNFLGDQAIEHAYFGNLSTTVTTNGIGIAPVVQGGVSPSLAVPHGQAVSPIATPMSSSSSAGDALRQYIAGNCHAGIDYSRYASSRVEFRRYSIASVDAKIVAYQAVSAIFAIYYVITMLNLVWSIKERKRDREQTNVPLVPSILRTFSNRAFGPLLAAWALDGLALSALVSMFPFYIRYVIKPSGLDANPVPGWMKTFVNTTKMPSEWCMGLSVAALLMVAICSAPFWLWLSLKKGKFSAWLWYNAANAISNILFLVPGSGDWELAIGIMAINGFPVGGQFLINSILSDVIDYDEFLNGSRSEGSFSVFATLIPKFVSIPAGALPLAIIYMLGFRAPIDGVDQQQTQAVIGFIRFCFILLPFVCVCLAFVIKMTFPIKTKETAEAITRGIALHARGEDALDPLSGEMTSLLVYSEEEAEVVWNLESFTHTMLLELLETRDHTPIVRTMLFNISFAVFLEVTFLTLVIVFFKDLCDPAMAIIPILAIIFFGITLCYLLVNVSRYIDSKKLHVFQYNDKSRELLSRVIQVKKKGQRAGLYEPLVRHFSMSLRKISERLGSISGRRLSQEDKAAKNVIGDHDHVMVAAKRGGEVSTIDHIEQIEEEDEKKSSGQQHVGHAWSAMDEGGRQLQDDTAAVRPAPG